MSFIPFSSKRCSYIQWKLIYMKIKTLVQVVQEFLFYKLFSKYSKSIIGTSNFSALDFLLHAFSHARR